MLVAVALTASAAKHAVLYEFQPGKPKAVFSGESDYNNHLVYTDYTLISTLKGFDGQTTEAAKTVTVVQGWDNRFAFYCAGTPWNRYYAGNHHNVLYNDCDQVNLFTVLNLRAGDIVKVKSYDVNTSLNMADRFVTAYSSNAIDNSPAPSGSVQQRVQEFIMQEDGNLDFNCAPKMELVSVEIVNPFEEYNYWRNEGGELIDSSNRYSSELLNPDNAATFNHFKAEVGQEIITQEIAPMDDDHINATYNNGQSHNGTDGECWSPWKNAVVQFRGDIHPTTGSFRVWLTEAANNHKQVHVSGFEGKGGAVVIMFERYMFVYTIPYKVEDGSKSWNFWSHKLDVGYSTENGSAGPESHSLQHHDNSVGVSQREKLYSTSAGDVYTTRYKDFMKAQNAFVNAETAGLMFWTRSLGDVTNTRNLRPYGYNNEYQKDTNGNYMEDGDGYRYMTILKGGGFTIPDLKAGDQVYIYMAHTENPNHSGVTRAGVKFRVWNAMDALKHRIQDNGQNYGTVFTGGSNWGPWISTAKWGRQYYGALHFYAAADGDMHFLMDGSNDYNYVKLCYIRIYRNEQDIIINTDELLGQEGYEVLLSQNPDGSFETPETRTFNLRTTNTVSKYQQFEVLECSGNLSLNQINGWSSITKKMKNGQEIDTNPTVWNLNITTPTKPLYGAFLLRGKDMDHNNKYCMNYADRVVAIGTLQQMNYPYTWNFKDILASDRGNSGSLFDADAAETTAYQDSTRIWIQNGSIYEMNNSAFENGNRNWSSGAQLFAKGQFIEEAAGVGFATWNQGGGNGSASHNGDIAITADGVRIQPQHQYGMTRVFLPKLTKDMKVFIQGKRYVGGKSGFGASYLTGKSYMPRVNNPWNENRYHDNNGMDEDWARSTNPLLSSKIKEMTIIKGTAEDEVKYDNFLYNFSSLDLEQETRTETEHVDEHLDIVASADYTVEIAQGAPSTVSNELFQKGSETTDANGNTVIEDQNGNIVQYVDENGNVIINGPQNDAGALVFDSNDITLEEDDNTYTGILKLGGDGNESGRVVKVLGLDTSKEYDITVVLKSQNSDFARELAVYGGSWGGTELGVMLARNKVMAKSIKGVSGQSTITIGSKSGGIEIYAVYVRESNQPTGVQEIPFIACIDMKDAEFYSQDEINLTMYLSDVLIEHMAVSMDEKKLNDIGWASESRQRYIDHSLNEVFNDKPVKAYVATGTSRDDDSDQSKLISYIKVSPLTAPMPLAEGNDDVDATSGTGCILYNDIPDADIADEEGRPDPMQRAATISLFVPAIHDYIKDASINQNSVGNTYINTFSDNSTLEASRAANVDVSKLGEMTGNMMLAWLTDGNLDATGVKDDYTYYVLSYKWKDPQGNSHPTAEEIAANNYVEKFVRSAAAHLKDNSAYIRLSTAAVNPNFYKAVDIVFDGEEGGLNGITDLTIGGNNGAQQGESDSYYTLSGQKINKPTMPGIYVKNGKKVFVK